MKTLKKAIALVLALCLVLCAVGCGTTKTPAETPSTEPVATAPEASTGTDSADAPYPTDADYPDRNMIIAGTPATSSLMAYYVGLADALDSALPWMHFTISEVTGAVDACRRVMAGECDFGNVQDNVIFDSFNQIGSFEGEANGGDVRVFWYYLITPLHYVVSKDSGVKSLSDLEGKKFNPGATGTGAATLTAGILDLFDIEPDLFAASQADAADAMTSRQIIGVTKTGALPESYVTQIAATMPIDLISMTDEEIDAIIEAFPYCGRATIPAGTYEGVDYDVNTIYAASLVMTMKDNFTQAEGYEMIKAVLDDPEIREIWETAYPLAAGVNVPEITVQACKVFLHPGMVQYLVENGYEVDPSIIPPEYVPVN